MTTRLSSERQMKIITEQFKKDIEELRTMPKEEARKVAKKNLMDAGIIDDNGNFTEPYIALMKFNVQ